MRSTTSAAMGLALAMAAFWFPSTPVLADGDAKDGNWLNSQCKKARLARAVSQDRLQGFVKVRYDIMANGRVTNIQIVESDPPNVMDKFVKTAVRRWRYFAYLQGGVEAERKDVELTFTFGGMPEDQEASCTHVPWPETATAAIK